jgi:hypothetical protein
MQAEGKGCFLLLRQDLIAADFEGRITSPPATPTIRLPVVSRGYRRRLIPRPGIETATIQAEVLVVRRSQELAREALEVRKVISSLAEIAGVFLGVAIALALSRLHLSWTWALTGLPATGAARAR